MNNKSLYDQLEEKKTELAKSLFSPQFHSFPLRTSKAVLRIAGELLAIASKIQAESTNSWGDK